MGLSANVAKPQSGTNSTRSGPTTSIARRAVSSVSMQALPNRYFASSARIAVAKALPIHAELSHPGPKGVWIDPEQPGDASGPLDPASGAG